MKFQPLIRNSMIGLIAAFSSAAHALVITPSTDAGALSSALGLTGISVVGGSESYTGTSTQGGTYSGFSLSNSSKTVSTGDGVLLTSGDATGVDLPGGSNTNSSFDGSLATAGDADADAVLSGAGIFQLTNDANILEFDFTVDPGFTSISADFVFATEEYPDQGVVDIFAFIVDGQNFAFFPDGSLVNFVLGSPAVAFLNDNDVGNTDQFFDTAGDGFEYDALTDELSLTAILDPALSTHSLKIVVADTSDTIYDTGTFISNLQAGTDTNGGIITVPAPTTLWLILAGLVGFGARKRVSKR